MKLCELVKAIGRECGETLQIARPKCYQDHDSISIDSPIVDLMGDMEVISIQAVSTDVFKIDLKWEDDDW